MKYYYFILTSFIAFTTSCEDVIEVDAPTGKSRLIVDALIRVDTTQDFLGVKVKVTGLADNINIFDNAERPNDFPLGYIAIVQEFKVPLPFNK